jgi:RNA polymerase sigma-70 factor, ECF subfamily
MTALHDEHSALFSFALRYLGDRDRARDAVQETLLRAWRRLDRIDPRRGDPRSYLSTVARNVLTDQWRAAQRRSVAEAAAALGLPAGTVKSRCFYAVRALRAVFEEMGVVR